MTKGRRVQIWGWGLLFTCIAMNATYVQADPLSPNSQPQSRGTLGYDLDYLMTPAEAARKSQAEGDSLMGQNSLNEIVQIGGRALLWVDLFQKNVPPEKREQVWRRVDRIGHEATMDDPMTYNPEKILALYQEAWDITPSSVKTILQGRGALPEQLPEDTNLQEVMTAIRKIHTAYSRASRWLALYPLRSQIRKDLRDLRPWIALDHQQEALKRVASNWSHLSRIEKQAWVKQVSSGCAIGGIAASTCGMQGSMLTLSRSSSLATRWFDKILTEGKKAYDSKFGVTHPHDGVAVSQETNGQINVVFSILNIEDGIFNWMSHQVDVGWFFQGVIRTKLTQTQNEFPGVVKVQWQQGALPHVDSVGGDTITMDSNTAQWLEHTQVTMTHEFGHVIGFPDCYVEFWDNDVQSFVFYTLDPDDRMCALSGGTLERHKQALLSGFAH